MQHRRRRATYVQAPSRKRSIPEPYRFISSLSRATTAVQARRRVPEIGFKVLFNTQFLAEGGTAVSPFIFTPPQDGYGELSHPIPHLHFTH